MERKATNWNKFLDSFGDRTIYMALFKTWDDFIVWRVGVFFNLCFYSFDRIHCTTVCQKQGCMLRATRTNYTKFRLVLRTIVRIYHKGCAFFNWSKFVVKDTRKFIFLLLYFRYGLRKQGKKLCCLWENNLGEIFIARCRQVLAHGVPSVCVL